MEEEEEAAVLAAPEAMRQLCRAAEAEAQEKMRDVPQLTEVMAEAEDQIYTHYPQIQYMLVCPAGRVEAEAAPLLMEAQAVLAEAGLRALHPL